MNGARAGTLDGAPVLGAVRQRGALASGIVSGLLGGAAMALFMMVAASMAGMPAAHMLKTIGATWVGEAALGGTAQILYGAALHALASVAAALVFGALVPRDYPPACAAMVGLGYALLVAGIMASLVLPAVNPGFRGEIQPLGGAWVVAHALYGVALGLSHVLGGGAPRTDAAGP